MDQQIQQTKNPKNQITTRVIRKALKNWRNSIFEKHPQCYVSNLTENLEVHHSGMSFNQIFRQAHKNLNIEYHKFIYEYDKEDAKRLKAEIIRLHNEVDAIVLTHNIHVQLHQIYGEQVTRQQIDEFKKNFNSVHK